MAVSFDEQHRLNQLIPLENRFFFRDKSIVCTLEILRLHTNSLGLSFCLYKFVHSHIPLFVEHHFCYTITAHILSAGWNLESEMATHGCTLRCESNIPFT